MQKIAFATYSNLSDLTEADKLLVPLLAEKGIEVTAEIWDNPEVNWQQYYAVIIRSTWNYYVKHEQFIDWIKQFETNGVKLLNPTNIVLNNYHKFYLKNLQQKGIKIIPTFFSDQKITSSELREWHRIVVKPAISAGSYLTNVINTDTLTQDSLDELIVGGDWLIQPYLSEIELSGEISLVYFSGKFSHAIQKIPKIGDFRVQKQYGSTYQKYLPTLELLTIAKNIVNKAAINPVYARVDGVLINNEFVLMEIEMIEPDLYLEFAPEASNNFVNAVMLAISMQ